MVHGRIEMSSAEQLMELRKARDRYSALADHFREEGDALAKQFESEGDPLIVMEEKLKSERDARRIANAYEKSIANIEASSEAMRQAKVSGPGARSIGTGLAVLAIILIAAGAVTLAVAYPQIYEQVLAYLPGSDQNHAAPLAKAPAAAPSPPAAKAAPTGLVVPRSVVAPVPAKKPPVRETQKPVRAPDPSIRHEDDIVVKVLQPDGTLKEQVFSARPRR